MSRRFSVEIVAMQVGLLAFSGCCYAQSQSTPQGQQSQPASSRSASSQSQGETGTLSGRLSGGGVDGATVVVTNIATGMSMSATTDANGAFTITNLTPGSYRIGVRLKSGPSLAENSIEITSNGSNQIQVAFNSNASATTPAVEIEQAPTVQTGSAEVSRSYDTQTLRSLPILDRQNQELITMMPGVTPPVVEDRINDPQRTRSFNVNGLPAFANLSHQDGAYDNEPFFGRPLRTEPNEAVQALEVRTSNYNAEYGVSGGSWASTVTRPGTNAVHGSLFEFNTNNFFRTGRTLATTHATPRFSTNQFGGTAGGAALPDRVFWFISYEGFIQRGKQETVATVPAAGLSSGNFSRISEATIFNPLSGNAPGATRVPFPGNTIPASLLNPASQSILALMPRANQPGFSNNLVGSVPLLDDNHRVDGKLDHRFSEKSTGFFRYGFTQASVDQGSLLGAVGSPLVAEFRGMSSVGSLTQIFTASILAEFRFGYDRYRNQISPWGDFSALSALAAQGFGNGVPSINIAGLSLLGFPANVPAKQIDNVYDGATNWIAHTGMHSIKFGITARELQSNGFSNAFFSPLGSFAFGPGSTLGTTSSAANLNPGILQANALAGFLTGTPSQAGVSTFTTTPSYRQRQYGAYITDTLNLFGHLYLELGVRYDIFSPIEAGQSGGQVVFDPLTNTASIPGVNGTSSRSTRYDLDNVAPRVGLAFKPFDRLVFRGGYGIHYFPAPFSLTAFNPATQAVQVGSAGGLGTTSFVIPTVPTPGSTAPNQPFFVSPRTVATPYVETYSGMIQGDLGNGFLLDIGYVGNVGRQLPFSYNLTGLPGTGIAGLTGVTGITPGRSALTIQRGAGLNSNFNSLQVNMTKKFAAGLAFSGAYTHGKALDYGTNLIDPFQRRSNYGPADWDRTHILAISHVWKIPFGHFDHGWASRALSDWEINGVLRWATGTPYTVTTDPTACACFGASALPATFNSSSVKGGSSIMGSSNFDPNAFTTPTAGTFGTLSRNSFRGPDFFTYNMALFRNFTVNENVKLEFRGEVYNLTNTSNFGNPVSNTLSPGFGTSMGSLNGTAGRQFQVAARLLF
jgi:hypothetical protein